MWNVRSWWELNASNALRRACSQPTTLALPWRYCRRTEAWRCCGSILNRSRAGLGLRRTPCSPPRHLQRITRHSAHAVRHLLERGRCTRFPRPDLARHACSAASRRMGMRAGAAPRVTPSLRSLQDLCRDSLTLHHFTTGEGNEVGDRASSRPAARIAEHHASAPVSRGIGQAEVDFAAARDGRQRTELCPDAAPPMFHRFTPLAPLLISTTGIVSGRQTKE